MLLGRIGLVIGTLVDDMVKELRQNGRQWSIRTEHCWDSARNAE